MNGGSTRAKRIVMFAPFFGQRSEASFGCSVCKETLFRSIRRCCWGDACCDRWGFEKACPVFHLRPWCFVKVDWVDVLCFLFEGFGNMRKKESSDWQANQTKGRRAEWPKRFEEHC